jgi:hypothetical protein
MCKMRRRVAVLLLLLATGCRYYEAGTRAAAAAVVTSVMHMQAHAPLTQSVVRPATPDRNRRLIASAIMKPCPFADRTILRVHEYIVVTPHAIRRS